MQRRIPIFKIILLMVVAVLAMFTIVRGALYVTYKNLLFSDLSFWEVCTDFLVGIRFDASASLTFLCLPILMIVLPFRFATTKIWYRGWSWVFFIFTSVMLLFLVGDIVYFGQVNRHVADELLLLKEDAVFMVDLAFGPYLGLFLGYVVFFVLSAYVWFRFFQKDISPKKCSWPQSIALILVTGLLIRGSVSLKPINIIDGFISEKSSEGQLVLNGVFSAWHSSRNSQRIEYTKYPYEKIKTPLSKLNIDIDSPYPFSRKAKQQDFSSKNPNVVIILLESWSSFYVDSFGKNSEFGSTPFFDQLSKESIKFENFFANGSRSIEAIQSILTSFPSLKGIPTLGLGFELLSVSKLGAVARSKGYETMFVQSSPRRSFRLDAAAKALGFKYYYGMEDFPMLLDYGDQQKPRFGYDYETYMFSLDKINEFKQPFLSFIFTGTTHTPFINPPHGRDLAKHGVDSEVGFLNTLHYADWSLNEFMREAKKQPWFDNTIFVFTADHTYTPYRDFSFLDRYQVPLLIHGPKFFDARVSEKFGSHLDLFPTVAELIGVEQEFSSAGQSLLNEDAESFVFISGRFGNPAAISSNGWLQHTGTKRLEDFSFKSDCLDPCLDELELQLGGLNQLLYETLRQNKWLVNKSNHN